MCSNQCPNCCVWAAVQTADGLFVIRGIRIKRRGKPREEAAETPSIREACGLSTRGERSHPDPLSSRASWSCPRTSVWSFSFGDGGRLVAFVGTFHGGGEKALPGELALGAMSRRNCPSPFPSYAPGASPSGRRAGEPRSPGPSGQAGRSGQTLLGAAVLYSFCPDSWWGRARGAQGAPRCPLQAEARAPRQDLPAQPCAPPGRPQSGSLGTGPGREGRSAGDCVSSGAPRGSPHRASPPNCSSPPSPALAVPSDPSTGQNENAFLTTNEAPAPQT